MIKSNEYSVDAILKHVEKNTQQNMTHTHNKQVNEDTPMNITSDIQKSNMQDNITRDSGKIGWQLIMNRKRAQITCQFTVTANSQLRALPHAQDTEEYLKGQTD